MDKESIVQAYSPDLKAQFIFILGEAAGKAAIDLTDMDWLNFTPGFDAVKTNQKNVDFACLILARGIRDICEELIIHYEKAGHPAGKARN